MQGDNKVRQGNNMQQRSYFDVLAINRGFVYIFCLSAIITTLVLTYIYSEKYESAASIFYQPLEVTRLQGGNTQALGSPVPTPPFKIVGKTLEEVLLSTAILEPIVRKYGLDKKGKDYSGPWYTVLYKMTKDTLIEYGGYGWSILKHGRIVDEDPVIYATNKLRANVKIKNKDSYIFHILVRDKVPERAALISDDLARGLVTWLKEKARKPSTQKLEQLKILLANTSDQVSEHTLSIQNLLEENNMASVGAETEKATARLSELELQKVAIDKKIEDNYARLSLIDGKLQLKKIAVVAIDNKTVPDNKFTPVKRDYIQPDDLKKLKSEKIVLQVGLEGALAEKVSLKSSIKKLRRKISGLPLIQNKISIYEMELKAAREDYARLNESYNEALLRATGVVSEAKFLSMAIVPKTPVAPIKVYYVGLAAALSLFVSIGLVYLFSYYNVRVFFASQGVKGRATRNEEEATPESDEDTGNDADKHGAGEK